MISSIISDLCDSDDDVMEIDKDDSGSERLFMPSGSGSRLTSATGKFSKKQKKTRVSSATFMKTMTSPIVDGKRA